MTRDEAVQHAGSFASLSRILGVSTATIKKWEGNLPKRYEQDLRTLRPEWFGPVRSRSRITPYDRLLQIKVLATLVQRLAARG